MRNFLFRVDASVEIGSGHVMRCLTLADHLAARGATCTFVSRRLDGHLFEVVEKRGHRLCALRSPHPGEEPRSGRAMDRWLRVPPETDAAETLAATRGLPVHWLIVDHYAIADSWESRVRSMFQRIMVIDDLADRSHACDLLLDSNFGRRPEEYRGLVPQSCQVLAGPHYVLLRPEFAAARERSLARRRDALRQVLVSMGGVDKDNTTGEVLDVLARCDLPTRCRIVVVMGSKAPWVDAVRTKASEVPHPAEVLVGVENMADLLAGSDLAIASGGVSTYERLFMGVPALVRPISDNQRAHLERMAAAGLLTLWRDGESLRRLLQGPLETLLRTPPQIVRDGTGATGSLLLPPAVELRRPNAWDVRRTYRWLQDASLRHAFLMRALPERRVHIAHWRAVRAAEPLRVFSIYADGRHVGNAGFKQVEGDAEAAEMWIYLGDREVRGSGVGRAALSQLEARARDAGARRAILHVSRTNSPAVGLYESFGYRWGDSGELTGIFGRDDVARMEKCL